LGLLHVGRNRKRSDGVGGGFAPPVKLALDEKAWLQACIEQNGRREDIDCPLPGYGALAVEQNGEWDRQGFEKAPDPDIWLGDTDGENLEL
jgi:hypothetical protein